jgi:fucose permease
VWNWLPRHLIAQGIPESRALNILSLGFALGLLIGRVGVSPILMQRVRPSMLLWPHPPPWQLPLSDAATSKPITAFVLVFLAGVSMAPVFPTTLAIVGDAFPRMTARPSASSLPADGLAWPSARASSAPSPAPTRGG